MCHIIKFPGSLYYNTGWAPMFSHGSGGAHICLIAHSTAFANQSGKAANNELVISANGPS